MDFLNLYRSYLSNNCVDVWNTISFLDYNILKEGERKIVDDIIIETLNRIDHNVQLVHDILREYGYEYQNFGDLNTKNQSYLLKEHNNFAYRRSIFYSSRSSDYFVPLFFASFCSYFDVIDFRGKYEFQVPIFLDSLFIESFNNQEEAEEMLFEIEYKDDKVKCIMFSPDQYIKENESGDLGACILMSDRMLIDNYTVNYQDDFNFTFLQYLRFCFEWACSPSLFWATDEEKQSFLPIIERVRKGLKPF